MEVSEDQIVAIVETGNDILASASTVHPKMTVEAVFDLLRRRINRPDRQLNHAILVAEDAYFNREYAVAKEKANAVEVGDALAAIRKESGQALGRLQNVEAMFYQCEPMQPNRMMRILSQKHFTREGINGPRRIEGDGKPLTELTRDYVDAWVEGMNQADAAAAASA